MRLLLICRDSKVTRLLKHSLQGKTKTCIITTIAPSVDSLEETLSTLHDRGIFQAMSEKLERLELILESSKDKVCV
jgi:hypothetical protein